MSVPSLCVAFGVNTPSQSVVATSTDPSGGTAAWRITRLPGNFFITSISCPSSSLCIATDSAGRILSSTSPAAGAGTWKVAMLAGGALAPSLTLASVSCPSVSLCIADGVRGTDDVVLSSTDPAGGAAAWTIEPSQSGLGSLSCPTVSLCVSAGGPYIMSSTDPTASLPPSLWRLAAIDGQSTLEAMSCPSASLCVALDDAANALGSSNPAAAGPVWHTSHLKSVEPEDSVGAVSCPSDSMCVGFVTTAGCGIDCSSFGQVIASTHAATDGGGWKLVSASVGKPSILRGGPAEILTGGTCPSTSLCLAIDGSGDVIASTKPLTARSWHSAAVDKGNIFSGISCASTKMCAAVDDAGYVLTSTNPSGGLRAWKRVHIDSAPLNAISCHTSKLCVAVDEFGNVLSTTNPTGGPRAWKMVRLHLPALTDISCPSVVVCVALDQAGNTVSTTQPTGGAHAWTEAAIESAGVPRSLSCPTAAMCLVGDDHGNVLVGFTAGIPRPAAIAALTAALHRSCSGERIRHVLNRGGCQIPLDAPGPGLITIRWLGAKRGTVAIGTTQAAGQGAVVVNVRLTNAGRRLLNRARRVLRLGAVAAFTDLPGHVYTAAGSVALTR